MLGSDGGSLARSENAVPFRDENPPFANRNRLERVPRLGPKTSEQAAGSLRVINGATPPDASAVHPEADRVVERILGDIQPSLRGWIGRLDVVKTLDPARYTLGLPTVQDMLRELEKHGRDPRDAA
jgi:uncharacterized protein